MKLLFIKTFLFSFVWLFFTQTFALDPRGDLNKISSEHFDIIYDAKSYELAKIYLEEAERSYQILTEVFGIAPEKTVVILDDTVDIANGSAIGMPRPSVNIYVNPPTPLASIDFYSFWPRDVFLHEYAHILNMEPARGVWRPFRFIFGSFIRPNMFLPRWYLEGLAVEMESRFNEFGRLKSTDYDALIRALYLDSKWGEDNLSAINETSIPTWPQGQRPYFYGALIWHELIQTKSISLVRTFNNHYARRIPWFITKPMIKELGKSYEDFLQDIYTKYKFLAQNQVLKLQAQAVTNGNPILTKDSVFNHSPEISPDGEKLMFVSQNKNGDAVLYILKRLGDQWIPANALNPIDAHTPLEGIEKSEIQKAAWFPNSQKIVFDSLDTYDRTYLYYDLYTYDLANKKTKRLTYGLRAREPAVSPKGDKIVFVKVGQGKTAIYSIDSDGKNETLIYMPPDYDRVSRPSFINDKELVFSQKTKGKDRLHVFNLETKLLSRVLDYPSKFPVATSHGIVFTSTKSGVENLYLISNDFTSMKPLTNSLTKIINGTIDTRKNQIIYSELTGNGPTIKLAPRSDEIKILPPVIHPIASNFSENIVEEAPKVTAEATEYSALPYMFPQLWMPYITFAEDGTIASIALPASDPTGFHSYLLSATYDSRPEKFSGYFSYLWKNSLGQTALAFSDYYLWYSSLQRSTNSQVISLFHGFYIPGLSNDWKALLSYDYKRTNIFETISGVSTDRNHYFNGPSVGFTYSNMNQKDMDISPYGQMAQVKYTHYFSNSTNTDYNETFIKLSHFHKEWLPKRHVLALSVQGSVSHNNRSLLLGTTTTDTEFVIGPSSSEFITRGYPSGQFIGYTVASGTLEYRFPIAEIWNGPNSPAPYFIKRIHGGIFAETLTLKGIYFNQNSTARNTELGKYYTSAGVEIKMDTTLFYHVPVTVKFVTAYGFEAQANGGLNLYMSLLAPTLF